ncbi:MAG: sodium/solute symporter [Acidobacteria bacterium]|jgi:SSS family solute:Na+ symporter|nr:sodium/solute symporter [Acidobacteriota bacterium]
MQLNPFDLIVFVGFIVTVVTVGVMMSRDEKDSESYFLAGRGLSWWLIGFSLIAANISTEQFVGMSGSAADYVGLAIASYEWMAAITLVVVAFFFLPKFLRAGIYTIPEFLEYRYSAAARTIMSVFMMIIYVFVTIAAVIYSGALTVDTIFGGQTFLGLEVNLVTASWAIGLLAAIYVVSGGLKACAWADLLQGSALIVGGAVVMVLAFRALGMADPAAVGLPAEMAGAGAVEKFRHLNAAKLHMVLPKTDLNIPWTALVLGLWIPNFYYWGLNQYITQRTLGAKSLAEGQKGVVFAAGLKLIIPFVIVIPGIIAFNLYKDQMAEEAIKSNQPIVESFEEAQGSPGSARVAFRFDGDFAKLHAEQAADILAFNAALAGTTPDTGLPPAEANAALLDVIAAANENLPREERIEEETALIGRKYDSAFALLIKHLIPTGLRGFMLAAILGAVMSSLASMLNAASTIFTMDLFKEYIYKGASQATLVRVGRIGVAAFAAVGCIMSPLLDNPAFGGIFKYIQEFQGFISPGILAVFVFGLLVHKAPAICGVVGLVVNPIIYGLLKVLAPNLAFLDRMAVCFFVVLGLMALITFLKPLEKPVELPVQTRIALESSPGAKMAGIAVVVVTLVLYGVFW